MTQGSQPQGGYFDAATLPDSGPYSANQWAALLGALQRAGVVLSTVGPLQIDTVFNDVGVFYAVDNQLEVTSAGANTININTGAAMVAGRLVSSDTALVFTVPINRTNDLIVVRQNWSAATYVPPASVDADEEVPPNTARVTRVTALVNDATFATYWDIPLADFTTNGAGAVTLNSDDRVYVDAETKYMYAVCTGGWNVTDGTAIAQTEQRGINLPDAKSAYGFGAVVVPEDYISGFTVDGIVYPVANGNIYAQSVAEYGACGENPAIHSDTVGFTATAVAINTTNCDHPNLLSTPTAGDIVSLLYWRDAINALDTINANAKLNGWFIEYFGWGRR